MDDGEEVQRADALDIVNFVRYYNAGATPTGSSEFSPKCQDQEEMCSLIPFKEIFDILVQATSDRIESWRKRISRIVERVFVRGIKAENEPVVSGASSLNTTREETNASAIRPPVCVAPTEEFASGVVNHLKLLESEPLCWFQDECDLRQCCKSPPL